MAGNADAGTQAEAHFDWLTAGVGYDYYRKESNYETDEYKVNRFLVTLRAMY